MLAVVSIRTGFLLEIGAIVSHLELAFNLHLVSVYRRLLFFFSLCGEEPRGDCSFCRERPSSMIS